MVKHGNDEVSKRSLNDEVFPVLEENANSVQYMTSHTILATKNKYFDYLNQKMIEMFPGQSKIYNSFKEAVDDTNNYYQEEFVNILLSNRLPSHKLKSKVNYPTILKNLNVSDSLYNRTRMVCRNFGANVIHAITL
ncbi:uncharacterized protein LOC119370533 [Jatropha curcas]|uniref:uncharacterized protein LOC119370533 n=1 Tax=Jatropha curcas TaxID=180498 RepID=UPI0018937BEA|nr:uncharacterized protein LOC119370533 [Jatropha curcas]